MKWVASAAAFVAGVWLGANWKRISCAILVDEPATPEGHKPTMRRWKNGIEIFD